ncbi:MAG: pyruvate formate lyase family protein [Eubacteriaceae bacterium]|nr:pyruvate formate lyase family protein [Eubacteriaceae bacterium]
MSYMERVNRLKERVLNTRPEMDLENAVIATKGFEESEGEPWVVRKAYSIRKQCQEKTVKIWDDELIVGTSASKQRAGLLNPDTCWSVLDKEFDTINERAYDPFFLTEEDKKRFTEIIKPYWKGKSTYEQWMTQIPDETRSLRDVGALFVDRKGVRGWGETTAGYETIINEGIEGIRAHIKQVRDTLDIAKAGDYEKQVYLRALDMTAEGIVTLAKRYSREAARQAQEAKDPKRKSELLKMAEVCNRVPEKPARTFWEAIQAMYIYQICIFMEQNAASYNPGRMDQYLYPFYKADIEAGRITQEEAQELLDCLWVKFSEPCLFQDEVTAQFSAGYPMFQNVCCGGIDERGNDAVNTISYMMLQATAEVQLYQPSLSVRYNMARNPDKFLKKISEVLKLGLGFPAFHNDEIGIQMMLNKGIPLRDAWNWNPCGCVETNLAGMQRCYTAYADFNLGSAVEFTLLNGKSRKYDKLASIQTGNPKSFENYEAFLDAAKQQIAWEIRALVCGSHVNDYIGLQRVCPTLSLSFKDCIDNAEDYAWGGAKYNLGNGVDAIGVADLINSIYTVKKLIYDDGKVDWDTLLDALDKDFEGYEDIKRLCDDVPKYGNDDAEVNDLASDLFTFIADDIEDFSSHFGKMTPGILPVSGNTPFGLEIGALPSGRKAFTPLADGLSPEQGTDIEGEGAVIKSVSHIPHARFTQGTLLNARLSSGFRSNPRSTVEMMNFLRSMCTLGVFHVQFNVVDTETLVDAQEHPSEHKGLMVRVAGYTAYFTELGEETQNDIISRTMHDGLTGCC